MTSATDNRTSELLEGLRDVGNLHEFAELFGFDWQDESDWTWHDVAVKMADDFEQAIAATLGSERTCKCVAEHVCSPFDGKTIVLHRCSVCHEFMRPFMKYCPGCGAKVIEEVDNADE